MRLQRRNDGHGRGPSDARVGTGHEQALGSGALDDQTSPALLVSSEPDARKGARRKQAAGGDALAARVDAAVQVLARARQEEAAEVVVRRRGAVVVQRRHGAPAGRQHHLEHAQQPVPVVGLPAQPANSLS